MRMYIELSDLGEQSHIFLKSPIIDHFIIRGPHESTPLFPSLTRSQPEPESGFLVPARS